MSSSRAQRLFLIASVGGILLVTLFPSAPEQLFRPEDCPQCDQRALADSLLNLGLYVPLGMALGLYRLKFLLVCFVALGLSGGIELAQALVPGRHPTAVDVYANVLGAALGVWLVRIAPSLLYPALGLSLIHI